MSDLYKRLKAKYIAGVIPQQGEPLPILPPPQSQEIPQLTAPAAVNPLVLPGKTPLPTPLGVQSMDIIRQPAPEPPPIVREAPLPKNEIAKWQEYIDSPVEIGRREDTRFENQERFDIPPGKMKKSRQNKLDALREALDKGQTIEQYFSPVEKGLDPLLAPGVSEAFQDVAESSRKIQGVWYGKGWENMPEADRIEALKEHGLVKTMGLSPEVVSVLVDIGEPLGLLSGGVGGKEALNKIPGFMKQAAKEGIAITKENLPRLRTLAKAVSPEEVLIKSNALGRKYQSGQIIITKGIMDRIKKMGIKPSTIDEAATISKNHPGLIKESGRGLDQVVVTLKEEGFISKAIDDKTAMDEISDILKNKESRVKEPNWDAMTTDEIAKMGAIPELKAPEAPKLDMPVETPSTIAPKGVKPPSTTPEIGTLRQAETIKTPKPSITATEQGLIEEAKKYKTAEEFVNKQGDSVYHGTNAKFDSFSGGKSGGSPATILRGHYFTDDPKLAKAFGENVIEAKITYKNPVIIDYQKSGLTYSEIQSELDAISKGFSPSEDLLGAVEKGRLDKWDTVILKNADYEGSKPFTEYIVKNTKNIKTKSQLTDIFNKAHAGETKPISNIVKETPPIKQVGGGGEIPPSNPVIPAMPEPNEWNEFYDLLQSGRLNEAEQKIPLIKGNLSKQSALEYLEDAKAKLIEAEDYYKQFPTPGEAKPKPDMLSYDEVYPTKYEMDIAKEQAISKHNALRDKTMALVKSKELSNDTMARIRKGLNIGSIKKASTPQLEELYTFVSRLEKGDKFISPKQSEALSAILKDIEHPELTPKRVIIDQFGDKEEVLNKGIMGRIPNQLIPTVDIKEGHPLITRIVNNADDLLWKAENETARRLTKFDKMLSGAEKSRTGRGIKEKALKTNPEIFDALSGKQVDLTAEERGVVAYLRNFFAKARKDLELDKFRKNYVTHIEQGLEEKIWNQGIKKTVSEMIGKRPNAPNIPTEIMSALDDIIGSEKFFKYSQKRTGALTPTQNLRKIMQEYSTIYERVMALNKVLPEGQAVQQLLLQPKSAQWMKRYLQNLKGRALDFEFRNGKAAWLAKAGDGIVDLGYLKLLGGNYWSALKNIVAGEANSFITTPLKSYLTGKARFMLNPKKALNMAKEYGILNDMFYEYATTGFKGPIRKLERYSMVGQAIGESEIRTSMLLAELTPKEWSKGVISMSRRRQILDHVAQTQGIFSKTQSPLLLQTTPGRMIAQMNRWRITNGLLVRRITREAAKDMKSGLMNTQNTRNLAKMFMLYGSGMYLSYELAKEGYKQASNTAKAMAETVNNMVELVTTPALIKMFSENPSFSVLSEFAYTAQELAAYIGVPGIQEPRKITFHKGIEDTYIAPYERTMELIGENEDVTGNERETQYDRLLKKYQGGGSNKVESKYERLKKKYAR